MQSKDDTFSQRKKLYHKIRLRTHYSEERLMVYEKLFNPYATLEDFEVALKMMALNAAQAQLKDKPRTIIEWISLNIFNKTTKRSYFPKKEKAFTESGINIEKLIQTKDPFRYACKKIKKNHDDPVRRVAAMQQIFGRRGTYFIPYIMSTIQ